MLCTNARFKPSMAVAINETVTTPMMTPSVVKPERSLLAAIALQEMRNPSRNSDQRLMAVQPLIALNEPIEDPDHAPGMVRHVLLVSNHDDRMTLLREFIE